MQEYITHTDSSDYFRPMHSDITPDMWQDIDRIIQESLDIPGAVTQVLRRCQDLVGYLPVELLDYIARGMNIPASEVFGVASFYSLFSLKPRGRNIIRVCTGTACHVKGADLVMRRLKQTYHLDDGSTTPDRRFTLESVRCMGACGLAPAMTINQTAHGHITPDQALKLLQEYY
ncbi:NADH dehydrogenase (ubiquinone) 24 kDa subunit [Desulfonatronospira thiodismutans ASO3-1]|uniref:NADH dehydrogenase (Ubiquinone) 24 kDa subunit n=1 Tax=Desulfonatronospira thiodismutans ASO3-1 TaxID=555779 RepID=D6SMG3_9BACT|nr:NAD(P)H-dependent oxidoreductase subunit E [Desulfonatronospira thiodismutans]EFI35874.1 NADH dehydrogenase (ubiquinone) 24 kDa subunit [Desulfonatronospira thiodismutans ASO3-1]